MEDITNLMLDCKIQAEETTPQPHTKRPSRKLPTETIKIPAKLRKITAEDGTFRGYRLPTNLFSPNVYIKTSHLPNAGLGLFARRKFSKGQKVCDYTGKLISPSWAHSNKNQSHYIWEFGNHCVDASDPYCCYGRYVCDSIVKSFHNVKPKIIEGTFSFFSFLVLFFCFCFVHCF